MRRKAPDKVIPLRRANSEAGPPAPEETATTAAPTDGGAFDEDDAGAAPASLYQPPSHDFSDEVWTIAEVARYMRVPVRTAKFIVNGDTFPVSFTVPNGRGGEARQTYWRAQKVVEWVLSYSPDGKRRR